MTDTHTPTDGVTARSPWRRFAAVAGTVLALGVLAAPALVPSASSAGELPLPYENTFDSAAGGSLSGDARIADGRLRLTPVADDQAGAWSTNDTFPSTLGLEVEFTYAMWNDVGNPGADGLLLFLADGSVPQGVGSYGAALGYACRASTTQGGDVPCDLPGVPGGFAAVALDKYGNFSTPLNLSGPGPRKDSVVVRGSGNGTTGYRYVTGTPAPGGTMTDGPAPRRVRVTLLPDGHGGLSLSVRLEVDGELRTVLDRVTLDGDGQAPLPDTLRLGFAAATGKVRNAHEIDSVTVRAPADLAVAQDLAERVPAGSEVEYTATARNVGLNPSDPSTLHVDVPDGLRDVTWTCSAAQGSGCGTASGTGDVDTALDLPVQGSAVVTVRGRAPDTTDDRLESTATVTAAPGLAEVDDRDNTSTVSAAVDAAPPVAQVETDKSVEPSTGVRPGDELAYRVTARNRGPATAQDVGAVDELPAAVHFAGSDDDCTAEGQLVTCRSGRALAPGESVDFTIRAVLDEDYTGDGSDVVNVATATSPTDPDGGDPSPGVGIEVDQGGGAPDPGDGDGDDGDDAEPDGPDAQASTEPDAPDTTAAAAPQRGAGTLAYTGAEGLGWAAALAGIAGLGGGAAWWVARRQRRAAADEGDPTVASLPTGD